jgi:hypothetical protein
VITYEWALRAGIGWLIEHRRQPNIARRLLNAFLERSIPTETLFIAVSIMGPRLARLSGLPALFVFILLLILHWTRCSDSLSVWSRRWSILFLRTL